MKRKYLSLILATFLCVAPCLSGCQLTGRSSENTETADNYSDSDSDDEDDSEDENHEDDSVADADEIDKPEEYVYVERIDEDSLREQAYVIKNHIRDWLVPTGLGDDVRAVSYTVTDLDHNGRLEIISIITYEYDEFSEVHIYEVDSRIKRLKEATWVFEGAEVTDDYYPEFYIGYYEDHVIRYSEDEPPHYAMTDMFLDPDIKYGEGYIDFSYSNGVATSRMMGAVLFTEDSNTFVLEGNSDPVSAGEFANYILEYWNGSESMERQEFGQYKANYTEYRGLKELPEPLLINMICFSYTVFVGESSERFFAEAFNRYDYFGLRYDNPEMYDAISKEWKMERVGDVGYSCFDYNAEIRLEFYDDHTARVLYMVNEETKLDSIVDVYFEEDGHPMMDLGDRSTSLLPGMSLYLKLLVDEVSEDGEHMTVRFVFFDYDGYIVDVIDVPFIDYDLARPFTFVGG